MAGVFLHAYAARLAYAAGSLAKAYVSLLLAVYWAIWVAFLLNRKCFGTKILNDVPIISTDKRLVAWNFFVFFSEDGVELVKLIICLAFQLRLNFLASDPVSLNQCTNKGPTLKKHILDDYRIRCSTSVWILNIKVKTSRKS